MFSLGIVLLMAIVATDLYAAVFRYPDLFTRLVPLLREDPASRTSFFVGRLIDGLAHAWMLALTLPLKEVDERGALAWAVLVVIGACDSVHAARVIRAAIDAPESPPPLTWFMAWPYRAWRVAYDAVILCGCAALLARL